MTAIEVTVGRGWTGQFSCAGAAEPFERKATSSERQNWFTLVKRYGGTDAEALEVVGAITSQQGPKEAADRMERRTGVPSAAFLDALQKHGWPE